MKRFVCALLSVLLLAAPMAQLAPLAYAEEPGAAVTEPQPEEEPGTDPETKPDGDQAAVGEAAPAEAEEKDVTAPAGTDEADGADPADGAPDAGDPDTGELPEEPAGDDADADAPDPDAQPEQPDDAEADPDDEQVQTVPATPETPESATPETAEPETETPETATPETSAEPEQEEYKVRTMEVGTPFLLTSLLRSEPQGWSLGAGFSYENPPVFADQDSQKTDNRNLMWVSISSTSKVPTADACKFSYKTQATGGEFKEVQGESVFYGTNPITGYKSSAFWTIPLADLQSGECTVQATWEGQVAEKTLTLVEFKLHSSASDFVDDTSYLKNNGEDIWSAFVCVGSVSLSLPRLKDKDGQQFLGWSETQEPGDQEIYTKVPSEAGPAIGLYPVFGVKKVKDFVVTDQANYQKDPKPDMVSFFEAGPVDIGADKATREASAAKVYVRNIGNLALDSVRWSGGTTGAFDIQINQKESKNVSGETIKAPAGDGLAYMVIDFIPKADKLIDANDSFTLFIDSYRIMITVHVKVNKTQVTITPQNDYTKQYGKILSSDDLKDIQVQVKIGSQADMMTAAQMQERFGVTLTSIGCSGLASANMDESEKIKDIHRYELSGSNPNYEFVFQDGGHGIWVKKAMPKSNDVAVDHVKIGGTLSDANLRGEFHNHFDDDKSSERPVPGELTWVKEESTRLNEEGTFPYDWKFTPSDTDNYTTATGSINVVVDPLESTTVQLVSGADVVFTYNGRPVDMSRSFEAIRGGKVVREGIILSYRKADDPEGSFTLGTPTDAGTYVIMAFIPANDTYAEGSVTQTIRINKQKVNITSFTAENRTYSGKADTHAKVTLFGSSNTMSTMKIEIDGKDDLGNTASFAGDGSAGTNKTVEIVLKQLPAEFDTNYELAVQPYIIHAKATIMPKPITLLPIPDKLTKKYGQPFQFDLETMFKVPDEGTLEDGDSLAAMTAEFTCGGMSDTAPAGKTYPITVNLTDPNYILMQQTIDGLTVTPAGLTLHAAPTADNGLKGNPLFSVNLHEGSIFNDCNDSMVVPGKWEWQYEDQTLPEQDMYTATWIFTVDDAESGNYEPDTYTGTVDITLLDKLPIPIDLTLDKYTVSPLTTEYTGENQTYTVELGLEEATYTASVTGPDGEEASLTNAGEYTVTITATPNDMNGKYSVTQDKFPITITQATPEMPTVELSGRENTRLDAIPDLPMEFKGVNGDTVPGTFAWENPGTLITEESGTYGWTFTPSDPNGNYKATSGTATVTMAEDDRKIAEEKVSTYNLPGDSDDYAAISLVDNPDLRAGDVIIIYKKVNGEWDPVSVEYEVKAEDLVPGAAPVVIPLDTDALTADGGTLYVHIEGKKSTKYTEFTAEAEPGFNFDCESLRLHPEGSADVTVVPFGDDRYTVKRVDWSCDSSFAEVDPTTGTVSKTTKVTAGKTLTSRTLLSATVTFTYMSPDGNQRTVPVSHSIPIAVTDAYLVIPLPANGGSVQPSVVEQLVNGEVRVTLYPASGYRATGLTVTEAETLPQQAARAISAAAPVPVVRISDNVFQFTMPDSDVYVEPQFEAIPAPAPQGGGSKDPAAGEYIVCEACGHHFWEPYLDGWRCTTCGHLRGTTGVPADAAAKAARAAQTAARGRVPQTADESRPVLWALVFLASAAGLGLTLRARKKRQ